mmetsp:Transcript_58528/g.148320  ORF Transcript_58528/g.148320 Transcript_58528/m.148320 type:complete len:230 (+) Transcript_58528:82-771(+)
MARVASMMLFLAVCAGMTVGQAAAEEAQRQPLISTDLLYDTYELFYGAYSVAWAKASEHVDVDGLLAKIPLEDVKKEVSKQLALIPPEAQQAMSEAQVKAVQLKAVVQENVEKARLLADEFAHTAITLLEKELPMFTGLVQKSAGNVALFVCYMSFVLYVVLKIFLFIFRLAKGIFCCFCCCGCCRRGSGKDKVADKNGKAKAVASKGKAAAASTNGKAAAAPKAKSKK